MERAMDKFDDYELNGRRIKVSLNLQQLLTKLFKYLPSSSSRTSPAMADPEAAPGPGAGEDHLEKDPAAVGAVAGTLALALAPAPSVAANLVPAPSPEEVDRSHPEVAVALGLPRRRMLTIETAQNLSLAPRKDQNPDRAPRRETRDPSPGILRPRRDPGLEVQRTRARDRRWDRSPQWPTVTGSPPGLTLPSLRRFQRKMKKTKACNIDECAFDFFFKTMIGYSIKK